MSDVRFPPMPVCLDPDGTAKPKTELVGVFAKGSTAPLGLIVRSTEVDYDRGFEAGVAVAFGIIGMAEAIRKNAPRVVERRYWEYNGKSYYDCGVQMKGREAGEDEGTNYEWCGSCRY